MGQRSLKNIESGTIWKFEYGFLTFPILTLGLEVKVIEISAIGNLGCGFLFAFHSNYGDILYRLRDIATYW